MAGGIEVNGAPFVYLRESPAKAESLRGAPGTEVEWRIARTTSHFQQLFLVCGLAVLVALFCVCSAAPAKQDHSVDVLNRAGSIWDLQTERFVSLKELGRRPAASGRSSFSSAPDDEIKDLVAHTVMNFWKRTSMNETHVCISTERMQSYFNQHNMEGRKMRRRATGAQTPAMRFVQHMKEQKDKVMSEEDVTMRGTGGLPLKPGYNPIYHDWGQTTRANDISKCQTMFWSFPTVVVERASQYDTRYPHYYENGDSFWAEPPIYCKPTPLYSDRDCKVIMNDGTVLRTIPGISCPWFRQAFSDLGCHSTGCNMELLFRQMCTYIDEYGVIYNSYADSFCYSSPMSHIEPFQTRNACFTGYQVYYLLDNLIFGSYAQNQYWYDNLGFFGNMLSFYTPYERHCE
ncbi:hypothetical protein FVE85_9757 [Porphyridium purpureum]|uniref:Uncharacterized protein n=1 Tax=Porphyridium purpureum TaxID=35688 RepID=A0A5J4YLD6_PORPP|nr:hypothetical protein FVE85_9757 [Porphyridium purpureum]|eukprot:POR4636..scf246_12